MPHLSPVAPCDFVVFGGTGDLAIRKLLPALYLRDRDGQLPDETRIVAVSRAGLDDAGYRDKVDAELTRYVRRARRRHRRAVPRPAAPRLARRRRRDRLAGARRGRSATPTRIRVFYLAMRAARCSARSAQRARGDTAWSTDASRVVLEKPHRPRPRLGPRDQRRGRRGVRRRSRSSGSTTTSARRRVQNLLVLRFANALPRAAVERRLHRPRADHRRPSPSASAAAAATTTAPARCATWCRTTCSSCSAWSRWSRPTTSTARPCATRSSRCCRRCARSTARRRCGTTVRGQYGAGLVDGERRARLPRPSSDRPEPHRDLRRAQGRGGRTGAGPACRSTCAPASGWPRRVSEIVVQFKARAALDVPGQRGRSRAQPAGHPAAARRGHAPAHDRQGARPRRHPAATRSRST